MYLLNSQFMCLEKKNTKLIPFGISQYQFTEVHLSQTESFCSRFSPEMWFDLLGGQTCCVWAFRAGVFGL